MFLILAHMSGRLYKYCFAGLLLPLSCLLMSAGTRPRIHKMDKISSHTWIARRLFRAEYDGYMKFAGKLDSVDYSLSEQVFKTKSPQIVVEFIALLQKTYSGVGLKEGWEIRLPYALELDLVGKVDKLGQATEWTQEDLKAWPNELAAEKPIRLVYVKKIEVDDSW